MQNTVVKYLIISFLLVVYINRGLFVFAEEMKNQGSGEINSVIEWVLELVTGESNNIDEDGDMQIYYSFTHTFLHEFPPQLTQLNLFSKEIKKNRFPDKENFLLNDFRARLDRPPEII